jgi:hypothetical protein
MNTVRLNGIPNWLKRFRLHYYLLGVPKVLWTLKTTGMTHVSQVFPGILKMFLFLESYGKNTKNCVFDILIVIEYGQR